MRMKDGGPGLSAARVRSGVLIDGQWLDDAPARTFEVTNPATDEVIAVVGDGEVEHGETALACADAAAGGWARTPARVRSDILRAVFDLLVLRNGEFADLITREMGKPLMEARAEVHYAADFLRWYAEEAVRLPGRSGPTPDGSGVLLVGRRPVGPCLLLTPWNFPLAMVARKLAPALAAGCTVVLKPSELTPLTCFAFVDLLAEAKLPPGVVNVVATTRPEPLVARLLDDPRLRKVSFTGSTAVGRKLLQQSSHRVLRTSMELGGNAPLLVLDDADLSTAIAGTLKAKFRNGGQACTAANRILVHEKIAPAFVRELSDRIGAIRMGPGDDPATGLGPLIDYRAVARTALRVRQAVENGARLAVGGRVPEGPGSFYPPTLLTDVASGSALSCEELFAPVAAITTFADESEMIEAANDTVFGLASYVFTRDVARGRRVAAALEVGMTALNTGLLSTAAAPFGGVKQSGHGREGGPEGIEDYLEIHYLLEQTDSE